MCIKRHTPFAFHHAIPPKHTHGQAHTISASKSLRETFQKETFNKYYKLIHSKECRVANLCPRCQLEIYYIKFCINVIIKIIIMVIVWN